MTILPLSAQTDSVADARLHAISVQVGTDIGGAVPVPLPDNLGTFRPIPKIYPNIGVKYSLHVHSFLKLTAELNYKHLEMSADAIVENMGATLPNLPTQYFTGRAEMKMSFDMLELPVYITFMLPKAPKNKIITGLYFAYNIKKKFANIPIDGFVGPEPDDVGLIIDPDISLPSEQTNFTPYLSNWDWGITVGYEREIYKRMYLALKFNIGCKDVFSTQVLDYSMNTLRGTITFTYDLFKF